MTTDRRAIIYASVAVTMRAREKARLSPGAGWLNRDEANSKVSAATLATAP